MVDFSELVVLDQLRSDLYGIAGKYDKTAAVCLHPLLSAIITGTGLFSLSTIHVGFPDNTIKPLELFIQ